VPYFNESDSHLNRKSEEPLIRVLIADDHTVLRHGLRLILNQADGLTVVGEAADGEDAVTLALELRPDVVLMDVNMPNVDGIEATRRLRAARPEIKVLMLTISKRDKDLISAVKAGAKGYLLKSAEAGEVIESIRRVAAGEAILPPEMIGLVLEELASPSPEPKQLTEREIDTLKLVAQGLGNKEIAGQLHISENTVKTHVRHILEKLHLNNRAEAAAYAVRHGLIPKD
jgi:DNA-binding NarL/FixJ family response regulator